MKRLANNPLAAGFIHESEDFYNSMDTFSSNGRNYRCQPIFGRVPFSEDLDMDEWYIKRPAVAANLNGVEIDFSNRKALIYRVGNFTATLRRQGDFHTRISYVNFIEEPSKPHWDCGSKIRHGDFIRVKDNIMAASAMFGFNSCLVPDKRYSRSELGVEHLGLEDFNPDKVFEEIHKYRVLTNYTEILHDSGVIANGLNKDAYPSPGSNEHLVKMGLVPVECTERGSHLLQFLSRSDYGAYERDLAWLLIERTYLSTLEGNAVYFAGPNGLGDKGILSELTALMSVPGLLKSINGRPLPEVENEIRLHFSEKNGFAVQQGFAWSGETVGGEQ